MKSHPTTMLTLTADAAREAALRRAGYQVVRVTNDEVTERVNKSETVGS